MFFGSNTTVCGTESLFTKETLDFSTNEATTGLGLHEFRSILSVFTAESMTSLPKACFSASLAFSEGGFKTGFELATGALPGASAPVPEAGEKASACEDCAVSG